MLVESHPPRRRPRERMPHAHATGARLACGTLRPTSLRLCIGPPYDDGGFQALPRGGTESNFSAHTNYTREKPQPENPGLAMRNTRFYDAFALLLRQPANHFPTRRGSQATGPTSRCSLERRQRPGQTEVGFEPDPLRPGRCEWGALCAAAAAGGPESNHLCKSSKIPRQQPPSPKIALLTPVMKIRDVWT
ncbi:hypothetical protein GJ744_007774 [Endocarpon pusillum]|uniref:Uncharacterized protein n=1 Tax=Endocarpon pusillum TaxID=364733 RepID=A0A8H7AR58_9EURO|nr:hypothetical protein GJ744_007774 [Endocarpon pusillum]